MYYIGIDLGTSAVKLLLMDETGSIATVSYTHLTLPTTERV